MPFFSESTGDSEVSRVLPSLGYWLSRRALPKPGQLADRDTSVRREQDTMLPQPCGLRPQGRVATALQWPLMYDRKPYRTHKLRVLPASPGGSTLPSQGPYYARSIRAIPSRVVTRAAAGRVAGHKIIVARRGALKSTAAESTRGRWTAATVSLLSLRESDACQWSI